MADRRKIAVLLGGTSAERDVSIRTGTAIAKALRAQGHDVMELDAGPDVAVALNENRPDAVFIALHGGVGEDGSIQGMLEVMGMPYTGSGVLASALAMDKLLSKVVFRSAGLGVVEQVVVTDAGWKLDGSAGFGYPVVVKPAREGSSIGISIVHAESELPPALEFALGYGAPAIVERYIKGKEIQIGVMGGHALGGVEVRPKVEFYSYEAKYTAGMTEYILPPELGADLYAKAMDAGLRAHMALGCAGASRVDLIVQDSGDIYVLEVNTIPGMTETSLLPKIASLAGMDFGELVARILDEALGGAMEA